MNNIELMLGDWVAIKNEKESIDLIGRIKSLTVNENDENIYCNIVINGGEYVMTSVIIDNIEAIELSREMLEKNGWNVDTMYSTYKLSDGKWLEYYHYENRLRKYWKGVDEWQNHAEVKEIPFACQCGYVHEFQHALRLCCLSEMADNFQV